jgi:hypothetical protein
VLFLAGSTESKAQNWANFTAQQETIENCCAKGITQSNPTLRLIAMTAAAFQLAQSATHVADTMLSSNCKPMG